MTAAVPTMMMPATATHTSPNTALNQGGRDAGGTGAYDEYVTHRA